MAALLRVGLAATPTTVGALRRCYVQKPHNKATEDYKKFKKALSVVRMKYLEEINNEKKMLTEDIDSQAAKEVRMEKEREAKALEENEKELQRMAEKRKIRMEELALKREMKTLKGIEAREKMASELKEKRTQEVVKMMTRSKNFVTFENLEEKIEEALAKEVNYDFALTLTGQKIKNQ